MTGSAGRSKAMMTRVSWVRDGRDNDGTHLEVLGDFTNEPLEGQLADKQLRRLLVTSDFTESDGSRAETMGLLHTSGSVGGGLAGGALGGELVVASESVTGAVPRRRRRRTCLRGALPPVD
jgi:hypothetical protein